MTHVRRTPLQKLSLPLPNGWGPLRLPYILTLAVLCLVLSGCQSTLSGAGDARGKARSVEAPRPNIVLILFEDMGPRVGAFGDPIAKTPNFDRIAARGIRFPNTFTTSGVCAPSRAALITGMHQQSIGAQHMRTSSQRGVEAGGPINYEAVPPSYVKAFPEYLRAAGYYVTNNYKTDYQFGEPFTVWDESSETATWRKRPEGKPFFSMITLLTTHESATWPIDMDAQSPVEKLVAAHNRGVFADRKSVTDPADVKVPPYYPDTEIIRADIARHYDNIHFTDALLGKLWSELEADGLLDETIVIVSTDHGDGLPRMKRSVFDSGIKVPMAISFPHEENAGQIRSEMVSFVDLAPTILSLAGVAVPDHMQGRNFLGTNRDEPRRYVYAAHDRHDQVPDRIRAVRDERFKYVRNYFPDRPYFRPLSFRDSQPTMKELWRLYEAGKMTAVQSQYFGPGPGETLFDLTADPHEVTNLAGDASFETELIRLRKEMDSWLDRVGDLSAISELEMIEQMWPDLKQPATAAPTAGFVVAGDHIQVTLSSATEGASIGYALETDEPLRWKLYHEPVFVEPGATILAKSVRYGFRESSVARILPPK